MAAVATLKREHHKSDCPLCTWNNRSYMLPAHIISHHTADVKLRKVQTEHCIYAYVMKGTVEHGFCVCLTCKKGVATEGHTRQGSRWVSNHMKHKSCKNAHKEALKAFKEKLIAPAAETPVAVHIPEKSESDEDPVEILWSKCKQRACLRPFMEDIEKQYKEDYDDNSDNEDPYTFAPTEGFRYCIDMAIGFKRETEKLNQRIATMKTDFEKELSSHKQMIRDLQQEAAKQEQRLMKLQAENDHKNQMIIDLQMRIKQLEENQTK